MVRATDSERRFYSPPSPDDSNGADNGLSEITVDDGDLDTVSVIESAIDCAPTKLPQPCQKFNENKCDTPAHCDFLHVCSSCRQYGHYASYCHQQTNPKVLKKRKERGLTWDHDNSYSPCAQASKEMPPVPDAPPEEKLPKDLVHVVRKYPELFQIVTPINVNLLEKLLTNHPNRKLVDSVIKGFRNGFWPYARIPINLDGDASRSQRSLKKVEQEFMLEQARKECKLGRYSPPFKSLYKGMICMPIRVQNNGKKLRLINDHSFGEFSLNDLIPEKERAAYTDDIRALIRVLLSGGDIDDIVLFKSDVSQAFRIIPMSPYWQALQAVKIDDQYYVDRCNCFGSAASQRLFCTFLSLVLWIAENRFGLVDILSYVDDVFSWDDRTQLMRYPDYNRELPQKQVQLLKLWDMLGIPHEDRKQEYGRRLTVIGYKVDLNRLRVSIPKEGISKIRSEITSICEQRLSSTPSKKSLKECRQLAGSINWALDVNPGLWPGVQSLHDAIAEADTSVGKKECAISERVQNDLLWLSALLSKSKGISFSKSKEEIDVEESITIYTDASESGFIFWVDSIKEARYFRFPYDMSTHPSIPHALAVLAALYGMKIRMPRLKRIVVYSSNRIVVDALAGSGGIPELHDAILCTAEIIFVEELDFQIHLMEREDIILSRTTKLSKQALQQALPELNIAKLCELPPLAVQRLGLPDISIELDEGQMSSFERFSLHLRNLNSKKRERIPCKISDRNERQSKRTEAIEATSTGSCFGYTRFGLYKLLSFLAFLIAVVLYIYVSRYAQ